MHPHGFLFSGEIHWEWPALRVHNLVRGVTRPYPGAFSFVEGKKLFIWKGHVLKGPAPQLAVTEPGDVVGAIDGGIAVRAGDGFFIVEECELENDTETAPKRALYAGMKLGDNLAKEKS